MSDESPSRNVQRDRKPSHAGSKRSPSHTEGYRCTGVLPITDAKRILNDYQNENIHHVELKITRKDTTQHE